MRIRTIKPETFTSESLAQCSRDARLAFIALWTICDDYGRHRADARLIKGAVFPFDDDVTPDDVTLWLKELEREGMICRYTDGQREYLHVMSWEKHQRVDNRGQARCPECPGHSVVRESRRVAADRGDSRLGIGVGVGVGTGEGEGSKDSLAAPQLALVPTPPATVSFDEFWSVYPRKVGKDAARKAWQSAVKREDPRVIANGAWRYGNDPNLPTDKQYIPHPATWLNAGRWADEPCAPRNPVQSRGDVKVRDAYARAAAMDASFLALDAAP